MFEYETIKPMITTIANLLNSGFGAALAGAFFGAMAASRIANRRETKSRLRDQLVVCNGAAALSSAIFGNSIGFKEQISKPLVSQYKCDYERYVEYLKRVNSGMIKGDPFKVQYNFGSISLFHHNTEDLVSLIVLQSGAENKALMAATNLLQVLHLLDAAIKNRELEAARLIKIKDTTDKEEFAHIYFGIPLNTGDHDTRMSDAVKTIGIQLDGTIFYSKFLAEKLSKNALELASKIGRGSPEPYIFEIDMEKVEGLLPDPAEYPDWQ
jgi:hypothetical protein